MIVLLLALVAADPEPKSAIKVIATGSWRHAHLNGKKAVVIRKGEDLAKLAPYSDLDALPAIVGKNATRNLAADLKVKEIDWNKQMVLLILAGERGSGGFRVEVAGLKVVKGTLTVSWKLHAPKGPATGVVTYPNLAVLLPKHTGKVVFDPPLK